MTDNEWLLESKPLSDVEIQAIDDIKKLMANYTIIHFQLDQNFLTKYLRASDWCVQKAFDLMKRIYKLKVRIRIDRIRRACIIFIVCILLVYSIEGPSIVLRIEALAG